MAPVRFFYDYVDPASYLTERLLAEAAPRLGLDVERAPYEATPPPAALVDTGSERWRSFWEAARETAAAEGVALADPRLVPWTRKAHELALHALEEERFALVHDALF